MRIGIMSEVGFRPTASLDPALERVRELEARGFPSYWVPNVFGPDAMAVCGLLGQGTQRIELGTAVVPTYPRHPLAMAQQALTAQLACGGRFALGIGLSHAVLVEGMLGMSFDRPVRHLREYLEILAPLLRGEAVDHKGEQYTLRGQLTFQTPPPPLLIAALGPQMLRLTGRLADGTITWVTGPRTLSDHIVPTLREAAKAAARPEPRVVAGLPIVLTRDVDGTRQRLVGTLKMYSTLPSYKAMLDREGVSGAEQVALVGDEAALRAQLARLRDAGVSDFVASLPGARDEAFGRTLDFLQGELGSARTA
jgi:F420-dependent oxidoreductase-like protein